MTPTSSQTTACHNTDATNVADFNPFVVFGASKSGTTWLQRILDKHPQIRCHFQRSIFPLNIAGRQRLMSPTIVVYNAGRSPYAGIFDSTFDEQMYLLEAQYFDDFDVLRADFLRRYEAVSTPEQFRHLQKLHYGIVRQAVRAILQDTDTKRIFGTKAYTDVTMLFDVFPKAKLIHIVRDGRDVAVSRRFHTLRQGAYYLGDERYTVLYLVNSWRFGRRVVRFVRRHTGWFGEAWFRDPRNFPPLFCTTALAKFASDWKLAVEHLMAQQLHSNQVLTLRYEDLRANTTAEITRVLEFLGAEATDSIVDDLASSTSFGKVSNQGGFFRKGQSGDWKNHFTPKDVREFKRIAGDLLVRLGYESSLEWGD